MRRLCAEMDLFLPRVRVALASALLLGPLWPAFSQTQPGEEEVVRLKEMIVTTATRTERLLEDVPVRTEVIRAADVKLRSPSNLSQAIELLNGARVESNCQNCNTSEVQLLGLSGAYNQILFDGQPLLSGLGGVYGIEQIPSVFVDRIEVVKGGGSALYGPGAVAGVINLVPSRPESHGGFIGSAVEWLRGTPLRSASTRLDGVFNSTGVEISLYTHHLRHQAIDYNGDGYSEMTRRQLSVGGFNLGYHPSEQTRLRLHYQATGESRRGGNRLDQPPHLSNIAEALETRHHRAGVVWEQTITPAFDYRMAYSYAFIARDSFYGGLGEVITDPDEPGFDPGTLAEAAAASSRQYGYTENPLHYAESQFNWRRGAHALAFGAQYKSDAVRDENRDDRQTTLSQTESSFSNTGIFVQDEWTPSDSLQVVLGTRLDHSSALDQPVFSPRFAAAFEVSPGLKWRAALATGFRAPEVFSEDLHVETLGADPIHIRNAPGLREERSLTYSVGLEWRSTTLGRDFQADLTASLTEIEGTFSLGEVRTTPEGNLFRLRENATGSRVTGLEANGTWQPAPQWRLSAGASYYRSRYHQPQVLFTEGDRVIASRTYLKSPEWGGVAQIVWQPRAELEAFAGVKYTGRMNAFNERTGTLARTTDFWALDAGLTRHVFLGHQHVDLSLGVRNLLDQRQRDLETGAARDSTYVYGPRFARSFYVSANFQF